MRFPCSLLVALFLHKNVFDAFNPQTTAIFSGSHRGSRPTIQYKMSTVADEPSQKSPDEEDFQHWEPILQKMAKAFNSKVPFKTTIEEEWFQSEYDRAQAAVALNRFRTAERIFLELTMMKPSDWRSWIRLAYCVRKQGRKSEAKSILEYAVKANPSTGFIWKKMADMEKEDKEIESARLLYRKAALMNPEFAETYDSWGRMEKDEGNYRTAKALFEKGIQVKPSDHYLWQGLGIVQDVMGAHRPALDSLRQAARLARCSNAHTQVALALCEFRLGRKRLAVDRLRRLASIQPHNTEVWYSLGRIAELEGDYSRARLSYSQVSSRSKTGLSVWVTWAHMEDQLGNYEAAARVWSITAQRFPGDAEVWVRWAKAEAKCDRFDIAREILQTAIKRWPHHPWAYQSYAELEMDLGEFEQARLVLLRGAVNCQEAVVTTADQLTPLILAWAVCEWKLDADRSRRLFEWAVRLSNKKQVGFTWFWWAKFELAQGRPFLAQNYLSRAIQAGYGDPGVWDLWQRLEVTLGRRDEQLVAAELRSIRRSLNMYFWRGESAHPLRRRWNQRPRLFDERFNLKVPKSRFTSKKEEKKTVKSARVSKSTSTIEDTASTDALSQKFEPQ
mmetsp:Transcript_6657/g.9005  ORF Transcript_6657/g.9005 Transcript_6657/m.9005 type:complete len:616 (+) Transcript_6657:165-2012(+)